MKRGPLLWLAAIAALAVIVAVQVGWSGHDSQMMARADVPTVQPGTDVLAGIAVIPSYDVSCIDEAGMPAKCFNVSDTTDNVV